MYLQDFITEEIIVTGTSYVPDQNSRIDSMKLWADLEPNKQTKKEQKKGENSEHVSVIYLNVI